MDGSLMEYVICVLCMFLRPHAEEVSTGPVFLSPHTVGMLQHVNMSGKAHYRYSCTEFP